MVDLNSVNTFHPTTYNPGGSSSNVNVYVNPSGSIGNYGVHYQTPPISAISSSQTGPGINMFNPQSAKPEMVATVVGESLIC